MARNGVGGMIQIAIGHGAILGGDGGEVAAGGRVQLDHPVDGSSSHRREALQAAGH
jgi:hypothetical protein